MAVEVVADIGCAQHSPRVARATMVRGHAQVPLATGDGVPDDEWRRRASGGCACADQHPAVVAVEGRPAAVNGRCRDGAGGGSRRDESGGRDLTLEVVEAVDVAEQRRWSMEPAVAAEEAAVRDDAAPGLADESGVDEVSGLVRRHAEKDLLDEFRQQCGRHAAVHDRCDPAGERGDQDGGLSVHGIVYTR